MQTKIQTKWFRERLAERSLSLRGLARQMDLDPASVSRMMNGRRQMSSAEANAIANLLRVPVTEVLRHAGVPVDDDVRSVAVSAVIDCEHRVRAVRGARIPAPYDMQADGVVLQVRCPSSSMDGWLILCASTVLQPTAALERLALVRLTNGSQVLGSLRKGYSNGSFNVLCTIPGENLLEDQQVEGAQEVLWIRPR